MQITLLTQSASNWTITKILVSNSPTTGFNFGGSGYGGEVNFSPDSNSLAIGEPSGTGNGVSGAGNVHLYNPAGTNWLFKRTLSAQVPTLDNGFGETVLFNPINNELAVFEKSGDSGATANVGVVTIIDLSQLPQ